MKYICICNIYIYIFVGDLKLKRINHLKLVMDTVAQLVRAVVRYTEVLGSNTSNVGIFICSLAFFLSCHP